MSRDLSQTRLPTEAERKHAELELERVVALLSNCPPAYTTWIRRSLQYTREGHSNPKLLNSFALAIWCLHIWRERPIYNAVKRVLDLGIASLVLVLISPILTAVVAVIKLTSRGPVLYRQIRIGHLNRPFWIYKFRTMFEGSEGIRIFSLPLETGLHDPRITPIGRFLRKWKLDELPQLFNVLWGDMSIVGPRPLSVEDSSTAPDSALIRFAVPPGLTGLWQATRSNTIAGGEKIELDCEYVRTRSLRLDLWLVLQTIPRILRGES